MLVEQYTRNLQIKKRKSKPLPQVKAEPLPMVTVTVVGEPGVGKSSIVRRFRNAGFRQEYVQTIGVERSQAIVERPSTCKKTSKTSVLRFLDTSEVFLDPNVATTIQDQVDAIHASLSNYVLIVYDVTDHVSFVETRGWMKIVRSMVPPSTTLVLVGNKGDNEKQREVHKTAGQVLASLNKMSFIEVSAKYNTNISTLLNFCR